MPNNRLLMAFPPEILHRLSSRLEPIELRRRTVLVEPDIPAAQVYFPDRGLVSLVKVMSDGRTAEVGAVGPEGMLGVATLFGFAEPGFESIVQLDGSGYRIDIGVLQAEFSQSSLLKELLSRYLHHRINQLAQTAACNRLHTLRQRCCRWLLTAHDSVEVPSFTLTHEFLALMMGVNRPRLSTTLNHLQKAGVIRYRYASVTISDRAALEAGSCECYESLRQEADQVCRP
jgi:CRP-like cAMP-binding protein